MTYELTSIQTLIILLLALWELTWKGIALWRSAHRNQRNWFIALLFINTAGILPILYLLMTEFHAENNKSPSLKLSP